MPPSPTSPLTLLVFAHVPPPVHGQSVMVKTLLEGLARERDLRVLHVDARLSHDPRDIGRWRAGKVFALLACCLRAWRLRLRHGPAFFYYVPAPGKRGALYRDLVVMLLCRPWFSGLVLHWHAVGLGDWLETQATAPERWVARWLLGRAALSIALSPSLASDAARLRPRRSVVIANTIADPGPPARSPRTASQPARILYLGLCTREKGVFATLAAFAQLHQRAPGRYQLIVAGVFSSAEDEREFLARAAQLPAGAVAFTGFADAAAKAAHFATADVFCFPTTYPHEGQPLTVIEAMAYDLPVVTTPWRGLPDLLPAGGGWFIDPTRPEELADALAAAAETHPDGRIRRHYLEHFRPERHLAAMRAALLGLRVSGSS